MAQLVFERFDSVAVWTIDRPAHRNRLHDEDLAALDVAIAKANEDASLHAVVLRAATAGQPKPVFSAGYNMVGLTASNAEDGSGPEKFSKTADAWAQLRPITVCALSGSVYGGATDFVLGSDLVVSADGLEFKMPAAAIGLHYYPSGLQRYLARLGMPLAKRAFFSGDALPMRALEACGLIHQWVPQSAVDSAAFALAERAARLAPAASQAMKQSLHELAAGPEQADALQRAELRMHLSMGSAEFAERTAQWAASKG